jgi:hypothetical protein
MPPHRRYENYPPPIIPNADYEGAFDLVLASLRSRSSQIGRTIEVLESMSRMEGNNMPDVVEMVPLSREEKLAAFIATVYAIDAGGCSPGFGRITREDEAGVDFTFSVPAFAVRKVVASFPDRLTEARALIAEGDEKRAAQVGRHPEGQDPSSGLGERSE